MGVDAADNELRLCDVCDEPALRCDMALCDVCDRRVCPECTRPWDGDGDGTICAECVVLVVETDADWGDLEES